MSFSEDGRPSRTKFCTGAFFRCLFHTGVHRAAKPGPELGSSCLSLLNICITRPDFRFEFLSVTHQSPPLTGAPAVRPRPLGPAPLSRAQVHKPEVRSLPRSRVAGALLDPRCGRNWSPGEVLPLAPPAHRPSSWRPQAWGCSWQLVCRCCPPAGAKRPQHRTLSIARLHPQTLIPVGACLQGPL